MKKQLGLIASLSLIAGTAFAADLPSRKEAITVSPPLSWSGAYAGINVGGAWSAGGQQYGETLYRSSTFGPVRGYQLGGASWSNSTSMSGVIGGGQIGYNYQFASMFVLGAEVDFQGSSLNGQSSASGYFPRTNGRSPSTASSYNSGSIDWFGTVRGRLGIAPMTSFANVLFFATGGFAYGGVSSSGAVSTVINDPVDVSYGAAIARYNNSSVKTGWTVGGGAEWIPSSLPSWSLKVEYLYTDLGNTRGTAYGLGPTNEGQAYMTNATTISNAYRFNTVRAGANYHFNFASAPVVAKF